MSKDQKQPEELYAGEHLPGQKTFLDLKDPDEAKPVFTIQHDVEAFTSDSSARYALECVSYSAQQKRLAACNGCTLITVPVEKDGLPDMLIDGGALHKAIADAGEAGVQCEIEEGRVLLAVPGLVTRLAPNGEGRFPDVYGFDELRKRWKPETSLCFSPAELELVVKYAKKIKAGGICLAFCVTGDDGQPTEEVAGGVRFTFTDAEGIGADVVGIIMPRARFPGCEKPEEKPAAEETAAAAADTSDPEPDDDESLRNRELAATIRKMKRDEPKWSQEGIAAELGISRRQVRKVLEAK